MKEIQGIPKEDWERVKKGLFGPEFYNSKGEFRNTWRLYSAKEIVQILKGGKDFGWTLEEAIKVFQAEID